MNKTSNFHKKWLNLLIGIQKRLILVRKYCSKGLKSAIPFLRPRYWLIYISAFCLGFYLWGPAHGWEKIRVWNQPKPEKKLVTIETLKKEIEGLKKELKLKETLTKQPQKVFTPSMFSRPALGEIIQPFDWINDGNTWQLHTGIDIKLAPGSNVMAAAAGTVVKVVESEGDGFAVTLAHGDGWESIYANLDSIIVQEGQNVIKGVIIGTSAVHACTSPEPGFHFGIYRDKQPKDPTKLIRWLTD